MFAIETQKLTKRFGSFTAVNQIDLKVQEGELFGLLGPNGAGKTTTLSMLATMLSVSKGKAFVNGLDVSQEPDAVRKSIGIVFQDPSLDFDLTAKENLEFHAKLYGLPASLRSKRILEVLKLVELEDRAKDLVKTFSGGMKRRLEIARGLLHHPTVLFLDEPTLGLDPQTRRRLWKHIQKLNKKENIAMILTTHYMEEADFLCDRIAIIDGGNIIALDSPTNLKKQLKGETILVQSNNNTQLAQLKLSGIFTVKALKDAVQFSVKDSNHLLPQLFQSASKQNIQIESVSIHQPSLEDVFVHLTGHSIREEVASAGEQVKAKMKYQGYVRR
ncbi:ATP-binding cassette domain-containing protein [Candidatus Micrarchaeota archaeon]|nr:ATP-binding cassette domain-containing protein [Candidatus Micrarchaeota archaeon]MBU1929983.1 ATP-binding cassette domain-containing protein [Candidatus Micrarchaeota archaeon]